MLDLIHHIPAINHRPLIESVYRNLAPSGLLILKDIDTRPRYKMAFTWILDMLMSPDQPPGYVGTTNMRNLLESIIQTLSAYVSSWALRRLNKRLNLLLQSLLPLKKKRSLQCHCQGRKSLLKMLIKS